MVPDEHVPTNVSVIEKFLPVKFEIMAGERGTRIVAVVPKPLA